MSRSSLPSFDAGDPAPLLPEELAQLEPGDSIPDRPAHWRRENFLPLRRSELVALLAAQPGLTDADRAGFGRLCRLLEAIYHYQFHRRLEELKDSYAPFDPDADTQAGPALSAAQREARAQALFDNLNWLMERANYVRLSRDDIFEAMNAMSDWGLRLDVDLSVFERLEVYARGDIVGRRTRRNWRNFNRLEEVDVPIYQRLITVSQLRPYHARLDGACDANCIYLKIFKNIPKMDVDMLLPGSRVCMTMLDRGKIFFPTVSGLAMTGWKIFQSAMVVTVASIYGMLAFLGLVAGTLGYGVKSFFGYLRTQQKYQLNLTRSLYYQNLDNNAGVLFRLLDEAEEQECREALLAWFLLWRNDGDDGLTADRLDALAEKFLRDATGLEINFEVADALDKLQRLKLIETAANGKARAVSLEQSLQTLGASWDDFFV